MQIPRHYKKIALKKNKFYRQHCITISCLYKERYFTNVFEEKNSKKVWEAIDANKYNNHITICTDNASNLVKQAYV